MQQLRRLVVITVLALSSMRPDSADATCGWTITPYTGGGLTMVAASSSVDAWAVGSSYIGQRKNQTLVEHWNGSSWTVVSSPDKMRGSKVLSNTLNGVSVDKATDAWAVGYLGDTLFSNPSTLVEHWNGATWTIVPSPNDGANASELLAVTSIDPNNVWAVGYELTNPSGTQTLIEHWNGNTWTVVQSPSAGTDATLAGVTAVSQDDIWAVGTYFLGTVRPLIEHWNGAAWSIVASPAPASGTFDGGLHSVSADGPNDVWAVGSFSLGNTAAIRSLIEHWNGSHWVVVPSPNPEGFAQLWGVSAGSSHDAWAVGDKGVFGIHTFTAHWDGASWTDVRSPNRGFRSSNALSGVVDLGVNNALAVGVPVAMLYHC